LARRREGFRRGGNENGPGIEMRRPDQRRFIRLQEGVDTESHACPCRKPRPASKWWRNGRCYRPMWDLCRLIWWALVGRFRPRAALEVENLVLRQQINVLRRTAKEASLLQHRSLDIRGPLSVLPNVRDALTIVQPDTVMRWHRAGFRAYWRWKRDLAQEGRKCLRRSAA
jgi:hypothetical protein